MVTLKFFISRVLENENINHYIVPIIKNQSDYLILHVNDATNNSSRKIVLDLFMLKTKPSDMIMERQISQYEMLTNIWKI